MSLDPSEEVKVGPNIRLLNRGKPVDPNGLPPFLFKLDGETLTKALISLFCDIWSEGRIPFSWDESPIILIFKQDTRNG